MNHDRFAFFHHFARSANMKYQYLYDIIPICYTRSKEYICSDLRIGVTYVNRSVTVGMTPDDDAR